VPSNDQVNLMMEPTNEVFGVPMPGSEQSVTEPEPVAEVEESVETQAAVEETVQETTEEPIEDLEAGTEESKSLLDQVDSLIKEQAGEAVPEDLQARYDRVSHENAVLQGKYEERIALMDQQIAGQNPAPAQEAVPSSADLFGTETVGRALWDAFQAGEQDPAAFGRAFAVAVEKVAGDRIQKSEEKHSAELNTFTEQSKQAESGRVMAAQMSQAMNKMEGMGGIYSEIALDFKSNGTESRYWKYLQSNPNHTKAAALDGEKGWLVSGLTVAGLYAAANAGTPATGGGSVNESSGASGGRSPASAKLEQPKGNAEPTREEMLVQVLTNAKPNLPEFLS